MVPEATLTQTEAGLVPEGEGWFVVNLRDADWWRSEDRGHYTHLDGEPASKMHPNNRNVLANNLIGLGSMG